MRSGIVPLLPSLSLPLSVRATLSYLFSRSSLAVIPPSPLSPPATYSSVTSLSHTSSTLLPAPLLWPHPPSSPPTPALLFPSLFRFFSHSSCTNPFLPAVHPALSSLRPLYPPITPAARSASPHQILTPSLAAESRAGSNSSFRIYPRIDNPSRSGSAPRSPYRSAFASASLLLSLPLSSTSHIPPDAYLQAHPLSPSPPPLGLPDNFSI